MAIYRHGAMLLPESNLQDPDDPGPVSGPLLVFSRGQGQLGGAFGGALKGTLKRAGLAVNPSPTRARDSRRVAGAPCPGTAGVHSGRLEQGSTGRLGPGWALGWVRGCLPGCRAASRWARCCGCPGAGEKASHPGAALLPRDPRRCPWILPGPVRVHTSAIQTPQPPTGRQEISGTGWEGATDLHPKAME